MTIRRLLHSKPALALLAGFASLTLAPSISYADDIQIPLDQVRVLTFTTPVKTVFVGNPVIADITVIDPMHVFILGKNFGSTNLVALDAMGREAANDQITVLERPGSIVSLQRGAGKTTMLCTSEHCEATPTPGDETARYDAVSAQAEKREAQSLRAAGSGQ